MQLTKIAVSAALLLLATTSQASTTYHRIVWDSDPSGSAVIGFSPDGTSSSPYVKYGYSTDESQWSTLEVDNTQTFARYLTSHFVRLTGLDANSAIYYRVCDQDGCGQRFWFKTAPNDKSPFVAVAGGDTRTGWNTRRAGNRLISKIRPLFIMHGGDFTDANSSSQMNQYLEDWALTYSNDVIDGINYNRIYPVIPTHGNHEDNDYRTLCRVFGVDYNLDGECNYSDTYGAFNISPLLRVYTLNSQFQSSGWSSYSSAMNNWLTSDLSNFGNSATWRFAQYHKPMFPHYTGKSDNPKLHGWWANTFYDYAMNLVVESDTHIAKLTTTVVPSGNGFSSTTSGGTVYVGEGSWGAPARSANDAKSWTLDLASIQQFKVMVVQEDKIDVRTAQFDASASTLSLSQRAANPARLPANVNWWSANGVGESVNLIQDNTGRTIIDNGASDGNRFTVKASEDTFISSNRSANNFEGSNEQLLADGSDTGYGTLLSLIRFDVSSFKSCEQVTDASINLYVFNQSSGSYGIFESTDASWRANTVSWNSVGGESVKGVQLSSFTPASTGFKNLVLNSAGVSAVNSWIQGENPGIVIGSTGTNDGIDISASESGNGPALDLIIDDSACTDGGTPVPVTVTINENRDTTISSGQPDTNLNSAFSDIEADGEDGRYGETMALIGFPVHNEIPRCATVTDSKLILNIDNVSKGKYGIYAVTTSWSANGATWNNVGGSDVKGALIGEFTPSSLGTYTYDLNALAHETVQGWLNGNNHGIVIATSGTTDGVIIEDGGNDQPKLQVTYTDQNCR